MCGSLSPSIFAAAVRRAQNTSNQTMTTRAPNPTLAFTRCCFTSKLYCGSQSSFHRPPHLQSLPYCNTIARPLHNMRPPTDPPFYAIHHTILVMAVSCKGQTPPYVARTTLAMDRALPHRHGCAPNTQLRKRHEPRSVGLTRNAPEEKTSAHSAFTRYVFTLKLYYGSQSSFYCPPPTYKAYPIAIPLHDHCSIYAPPPTPLLYAIHHTILVTAISCKGQTPPVCGADCTRYG